MSEQYIDMDFQTFKQKSIEILKESETFKDFNYEGSNISIIIELLSYLVEMNTYYQNKIIDNMYIDSATMYNSVHRLASLIGYKPKGHISAYTDLKITITGDYSNKVLTVPAYSVFKTDDGITFITTIDHVFTVPSDATESYEFTIGVKQGEHERLIYSGRDLVDYAIILPTVSYDHDDNIINNEQSVKLYVNPNINDEQWIRVPDVFQVLSGLETDDNVYSFEYDKYQNYKIYFSYARNYPGENDEVVIDLIRTIGSDGITGINLINEADAPFILINESGNYIPLDDIVITNEFNTMGGVDPEPIEDIKLNATSNFNMQYRCVTRPDFNNYLKTRTDVYAVNVWGEKEQNPDPMVIYPELYNQIYITIIPNEWGTSTIETTPLTWDIEGEKTVDIFKSDNFTTGYKEKLAKFLEPQKLLNNFENYILPDLVFFSFDIGLEVKRHHSFNSVSNAINEKLRYYFNPKNRVFESVIDFREIKKWLIDPKVFVSKDINLSAIRGIKNLVIRDLRLINSTDQNETIYEHDSDLFPRFTSPPLEVYQDNVLRPIVMNLTQFPMVTEDTIRIFDEG